MDILITCFSTGVSLPCLDRDGQRAKNYPSHNVMFWVFRQKVIARRDFLGSSCVAIHSERPGMHLFSVTRKYPLFTVAWVYIHQNLFLNLFSYNRHTKGQALLLTKSLNLQFIPNVHRFVSFTTRSVNSFGFGFPRTRVSPSDQPILSQMQWSWCFQTLILPEWTFLARILATVLVCLWDGFLCVRVASVVSEPLLGSISERHSLLDFSFGAPYAQYSKSEIQQFYKRCLSAWQCSCLHVSAVRSLFQIQSVTDWHCALCTYCIHIHTCV